MQQEQFITFNEIDNPLLRAYNRVVMLHNIQSDYGDVGAIKYIEAFDNDDRMEMMGMLFSIQHTGLEEVKREVMASVVVEDVA